MVLGDCVLNVFTVYAPHSGKPDEEKESFWNEVFHLVSCIPQNEMVVFAGHIGSSNVGYDGTHGGFRYGSRNADGSRILEFADGLNLVICNTLFTKQEAKLVTYVVGPVKSTVDYIMVRQEDKAKVRNVKVISSEECVPKHKLLVMDMWFNGSPACRPAADAVDMSVMYRLQHRILNVVYMRCFVLILNSLRVYKSTVMFVCIYVRYVYRCGGRCNKS